MLRCAATIAWIAFESEPGVERGMSISPGWFLGVVLLGWADGHGPSGGTGPDVVQVRGKVITLAAALEQRRLDIKPDREPIAKQVVLLAADGSVIPLFSDEASRGLFLDERLQNCPAELTGKRYPGLPYLQVISFKIEKDGRFQTPEYYCHVCAIRVRYPQSCPCCQGPMELRMKPDGG
jgi:hypothetical protein